MREVYIAGERLSNAHINDIITHCRNRNMAELARPSERNEIVNLLEELLARRASEPTAEGILQALDLNKDMWVHHIGSSDGSFVLLRHEGPVRMQDTLHETLADLGCAIIAREQQPGDRHSGLPPQEEK